MAPRVLVVEDDPILRDVVAGYLRRAGMQVEVAADGSQGWTAVQRWRPDLIVLDVMLPLMSGLELLRRLRAREAQTAVLVLSALGDFDDRVVGLEQGADDYVAKPFSPRELVLRVEGLLRRREQSTGAQAPQGVLEIGGLAIDARARTVDRGTERLVLTNREFDLLAFLGSHPNRAFTKQELLERVWGWEFGDTSTVTVHVRRLREKIERDPSDPDLIATVWGVGYRLDRPGAGSRPVVETGGGQAAP